MKVVCSFVSQRDIKALQVAAKDRRQSFDSKSPSLKRVLLVTQGIVFRHCYWHLQNCLLLNHSARYHQIMH